jgi:hypothetical protein
MKNIIYDAQTRQVWLCSSEHTSVELQGLQVHRIIELMRIMGATRADIHCTPENIRQTWETVRAYYEGPRDLNVLFKIPNGLSCDLWEKNQSRIPR